MSAEAIATEILPAVITLDDLAAIMHRLNGDVYEVAAQVPLGWLLQTEPMDQGLS